METDIPLLPFIVGDPVPPEKFFGRRNLLTEIPSAILSDGQSISITGEPKSGKTSLLKYFEERGVQYGSGLRFTFVDCQALSETCNWEEFWRNVFYPFDAEWEGDAGPLGAAYRKAREQKFYPRALQDFLKQLNHAGQRCVLLLDERDALSNNPALYCRDFLGELRSTVTTCQGLAMVSAGRMGVDYFNRKARELTGSSSEYLNSASERLLGPLEEEAVDALIRQGGERFARHYSADIRNWAGGLPYLLQAAASALWWNSRGGQSLTPDGRREAWERYYSDARMMLDEAWALWPPLTRCALTLIALPEMERVAKLYSQQKLRRLWQEEYLDQECKWLEKHGYICADAGAPTGWRVGPRAVIRWLEDELLRLARDERAFEEWLRKSRWEGITTAGDKERVRSVISTLGGFARETVVAFLQAVGKGAGEAVVDGLGAPPAPPPAKSKKELEKGC